MTKIAKQLIILPAEVIIQQKDGVILVKGPKGELEKTVPDFLQVVLNGKEVLVSPKDEAKADLALWGTWRMLIANMVKGVNDGFQKKLELEGVGFKAAVEGNKLALSLGFSHPIKKEAPPGIQFKVEKNVITIEGIDKELVGQVAAQIRDLRPPEPYKGKGIRYQGEIIKRKAGKKAVGAGGP